MSIERLLRIVDQLNFATEFLAESAIITARNLDRHFRETGTLVGPLHGVPTSVKVCVDSQRLRTSLTEHIKEHVAIGGARCNASFVSKIDNIVEEDALIVKLLKAAGAVIHVRTNQPQSIMVCINSVTTPISPFYQRLTIYTFAASRLQQQYHWNDSQPT